MSRETPGCDNPCSNDGSRRTGDFQRGGGFWSGDGACQSQDVWTRRRVLKAAGELARMSEVLDKAFELLGKDIALAHAKDLDKDGDAGHLPAGHGKLDYDRYLSLLCGCGYSGPILLHGLSAEQVPGCAAFLRERLARVTSAPAAKAGRG